MKRILTALFVLSLVSAPFAAEQKAPAPQEKKAADKQKCKAVKLYDKDGKPVKLYDKDGKPAKFYDASGNCMETNSDGKPAETPAGHNK